MKKQAVAAPAPQKAEPERPTRHTLSRRQWRFLGACIMVAVSLAARLPWHNADAGNPGLWTYGYFVTDEGYYTSGGRLQNLTGHCLAPELLDPPTFGAAPAMHYLSALSYRLRGITYDACRLPAMLASAAGWSSAYWMTSYVTHPAVALGVTLVLSLNPLSLTYERASSSDAMVGAIVIMAVCLLRSRKIWSWFPAGALLALAPAIKLSGIAFVPLAVLVAVTLPPRRWLRLGLAAAGFASGWAALHGLTGWVLRSHPSQMDTTVLRNLCSMSAGCIPPTTLDQTLRALPVFPRYPVDTRLGIFIAWCLALPAWAAIAHVTRGWRHWRSRRLALYLGVLAFGTALAIQVNPVERYFLSLVPFTPFLLVNARASIFRYTKGVPLLRALVLAGAALVALTWFWAGAATTHGRNPNDFLTNEYNLPVACCWSLTWPGLALISGMLFAALAPWHHRWRGVLIALLAAPVCAQLFIHAWNMARLAEKFTAPAQTTFLVQQLLLLATLGLFAVPGRHCRWTYWYGVLAALFLAAAVGDVHWRRAYPALLKRTDAVYQAAKKLERSLPENSIVLGNRASSLMRGSRFALGCCSPNFASAQHNVDVFLRILSEHPGRPVFLLVDEDHSYHWSNIQQKGMGVLNASVVGHVPLPAAGGEGKTLRVFVVQLTAKNPGPFKTGPKGES